MRMIPSRAHEESTGSERKIFTLLGQISAGQDAVAMASLNLAEIEYQRWGEIDFVLILSEGVFAIEVKGGLVSCEDGIWKFTDHKGRIVEKILSPIAQAQRGYSSLINNYLKVSHGNVIDRATSGFCVVFPGTTLKNAKHLIGGPEMPAELVATEEDCRNPAVFKAFLSRVTQYWRAHKTGPVKTLFPDEIKKIAATLRPSFDRVPPLALTLKRIRDEQYELTDDQYRLLDFTETAQRLVCIGGAGGGKTFIAVECLRREAHSNLVFVTGTASLARHLRALNVPDPSRIYSFEEVLANREQLRGKFSTLIVDEGQQITTSKALQVLGDILDKPFSEARWRWFCDPNHQVSATSGFDKHIQTQLEEWASVCPPLRDNCRNTPQIVTSVEFVAGIKLGSTLVKGRGPEVRFSKAVDVVESNTEAAQQIIEWTKVHEIHPGDIVLLSPKPVSESSIPEIAKAAGLRYQEWGPAWDRLPTYPKTLGASTIEEFRGIEAPVVVLCDLGGDMEQLERLLYLGMTRANFGLFVCCDPQALTQLGMARVERLQKNI